MKAIRKNYNIRGVIVGNPWIGYEHLFAIYNKITGRPGRTLYFERSHAEAALKKRLDLTRKAKK